MKRKWWVVAVILAAIGVLWIMASDKRYLAPLQTAIGLKPASVERAKSKPICGSPVNPNVAAPSDCLPQHMANLPPDPGKEGESRFIDVNNDGVRDDVERFIEINYGHSRRAVAALREVAKAAQLTVAAGSVGVTREEAKELGATTVMKAVSCFMGSAPDDVKNSQALTSVVIAVMNTQERHANQDRFEMKAAQQIYEFNLDTAVAEQCGYDPKALPN